MTFEWDYVVTYFPVLIEGAFVTLQVTMVTLVLATVFGTIMALMRISKNRFLKGFSGAYVWIFRGIPQLLVLFFVYYASPSIGVNLPAFTAAVLGLTINATAYSCEIIRSGIQAIPKGQVEAATAVGMSYYHIFMRIVLPQAVRIVIPPYINNAILLLKNSSLVSVITVADLMLVSQQIYSTTYRPIEILSLAGVLYLIMTSALMIFQNWAEKRLSYYTN